MNRFEQFHVSFSGEKWVSQTSKNFNQRTPSYTKQSHSVNQSVPMQSSSLNQLVSSFSTLEIREVRKFLTSPFFNTRSDLVDLFDNLANLGAAEKTEVWQRLHPSQTFDDQKLRLLMSYLHRLLEQYLAFKEATTNDLSNRLNLAIAYRNRGMITAFERTSASLEKTMDEQPLRDAQMHHHRYQLHWEKYHVATAQNPAADLPIHQLTRALDAYYVSLRLRLICFAIAQKKRLSF